MMRIGLMAAALMLPGVSAAASAQQPACFAPPHTFDGARTMLAARTLGGEPRPSFTLAEPAHVQLVEARTLILVAPPARPVNFGDKGGLVRLHVALGGTYRFMLGGAARIDLVQKGRPAAAIGEADGAACSGIVRQVDYRLASGDYTIQLTEARADALDMLVTKVDRTRLATPAGL